MRDKVQTGKEMRWNHLVEECKTFKTQTVYLLFIDIKYLYVRILRRYILYIISVNIIFLIKKLKACKWYHKYAFNF